jgi:hypothetical protein
MSDIPEESLNKKRVNPDLVRIQNNLFVEDTAVDVQIYTVPEGYVYEITHVTQGLASNAATQQGHWILTRSPGLSDPKIVILATYTDHIEHINNCCSFNPLTVLVDENETIHTISSANPNRTVVVHGFLIKKSEFSEKTNINI